MTCDGELLISCVFGGLNRGSEKLAESIDRHLGILTVQVKDGRAFLEREVWPEAHRFLANANQTLHHIDDVLEDVKVTFLKASNFLDTSNLAVRILTIVAAILLLVTTIFVCRKILRKLASDDAVDWLLKIIMELVMFLCAALVLFLFYQLVIEFLGFKHRAHGTESLHNVYLFIFPPVIVLAMLRHCIYYTLLAFAWTIRLAGRVLIYWPFLGSVTSNQRGHLL